MPVLTEVSFHLSCTLPLDVDWEDCGYDKKHRDFFRLLRHRHIDVFAAYEHMCSSEDFLSHLYRRNVLNSPEHDKLLKSSQNPLVQSSVNKLLMDVVNQKPKQLQELFVDLLYRYQTQLVMVHEETSAQSGEHANTLTSGARNSAFSRPGNDHVVHI